MGAGARRRLLFIAAMLTVAAPARADGPSLVEQAERARLAGDLSQAADLYRRARISDPSNEAAARGACVVAAAIEESAPAGQKVVSSTEPCRAALKMNASPENLRNSVFSQMAQVQPPTLDDLVIASLTAETAIERAPKEPWGFLARCDIGRRLGNADIVEDCLKNLQRIAPGAPLTIEAIRRTAPRVPVGIWLLRFAAIAWFVGTLADAWRRRRSAKRGVPPASARPLSAALAVFLLISFVFAGSSAAADTRPLAADKHPLAAGKRPLVPPRDHLSKIVIDDAHPEASIPTPEQQLSGPLQFGYFLQDLVERAIQARKKGDHERAARYYRALTLAAPKSPVGPRELCTELRAMKDNANAVVACRTVITRQDPTVGDYDVFVRTVLAHKGTMPSGERKELDDAINLIAKDHDPTVAPIVAKLRCEVSLRFGDAAGLEACSNELAKLAPKDPETVSYQWALAIQKNDRDGATKLVDRARELGMKEDGVVIMEKRTAQLARGHRGILAIFLAVAAFGAAFFFLTRKPPVPPRAPSSPASS